MFDKLDSASNAMRIYEVLLFAVLIGVLPIFMGNYSYGIGDQAEHLPRIFRQLDSSYLAQDFTVNASSGFGHRFYYSRFIVILARYCPLPVLFLLLTCLTHTLIALLTYLVSRNLFRNSDLAAMMACTLTIAVYSIKIGMTPALHSEFLTPAFLMLPVVLLSLWMGIKRKPLICAGLAAIASIIHPLVGLEVGAIGLATAGLSILLRLDNEVRISPAKFLREIGKVIIGAIFLGIFTLFVWIVPYNRANVFIDSARFVDIHAYFRVPFILVPSTFGIIDYIALLSFLLAFAISWKWWHDEPLTDKILARRILIPVIIVLILCVCSYIFVEIFPSRLWATALIFRLLFIVKWLGLIVMAGTIARILKRSKTFGQSYGACFLLMGSGLIQPLFLLFGHIAELFRKRARSILPLPMLRLGPGMALLAAGIGLVKFGSARESFTLFLFVAISCWFLLLPRRWYRGFVPSISLLCIAILIFGVNRYHQIPFLSHYFNRLQPIYFDKPHPRPELEFMRGSAYEIFDYARDNTPEDAIFLTPPLFGGFRLAAKRAIVVDFKYIPCTDQTMVEWRRRLLDCYGEVESAGYAAAEEMDRLYEDITDERILFIAGKYGASYAVLYRYTPSEFPTLYQNSTYKIVEIIAE